jgi:transposase
MMSCIYEGMHILFDHAQTKVFFPAYQDFIEVDVGIASLLTTIWDAGIMTCNSCEESEPGIMWIEFYSMRDVERFLMIQIRTLGDRIHKYPEANDWFCYRILGYEGDRLCAWRYDAHPNVYPIRSDQSGPYSRRTANCTIELSISARFPREDYSPVLDLINNFLERGRHEFEELTDQQWDLAKRYLPPQPVRGRKRSDDRRTLNGILYVLQNNCSWRELPPKYGSYETAQRRMKQWSGEGVLDAVLSSVKDYQSYKVRLSEYQKETDSSRRALGLGRKASHIITPPAGEMTPIFLSR